MSKKKSLISFDWAAKRILREKANFDVLDGFLSVLLDQPIHITELLESEGNQDQSDSKFNRVDVMARTHDGEQVIIEIQLSRQVHFLERMLFGVGKALTESVRLGDEYRKVKKIYSIGILYFDFGAGEDYVYRGQTKLVGVHSGDEFKLTERDRDGLDMRAVKDIFPEYYLIRVNEFDKLATTPLDEWIDYLKTGKVKEDTQVQGLLEAKEKLDWLKMSETERQAYEKYQLDIMNEKECLATARDEGKEEGIAIGKEEGIAIGKEEGIAIGKEEGIAIGKETGKLEMARNLMKLGMDIRMIARASGLSIEEIQSL